MFKVAKRDGEVAEFDLSKIGGAIAKAFEATGMEYTQDMIELLDLRVTADFQKKIRDGLVDVSRCSRRRATATWRRRTSCTASSARRFGI